MPVIFIEAPAGIRTVDKKRMVEKITTAMEEAYPLSADNRIFLREHPLENVGWASCLQSENPEFVDASKKLNG
jgi:hypothetical protein